ncbi:MAG: OFA family MFS transporter [Clostridia bacterium]|nr:OFA family MFS transporter [Clostridia bacterium]
MFKIKSQNKWLRGAIPALLLHCSIGTVYCWSTFSQNIAEYMGHAKSDVEWAFSLAIFFLGMSAAFLGSVVEKNIHRSSLIAAVCFAAGMIGSGLFMMYGHANQGSTLALIGILVCYGFVMGVGLGTGYLSPVKTLMLWFKSTPGLATGLAVAGFGAAKAIATPIMEAMMKSMTVDKMFIILGCVYFVMMFIGHILLAKPADWHEPAKQEKGARAIDVIKQKPVVFVGIWLMFYLNITCGLALISQEKMIFKAIGLADMVAVLGIVSAVFNAGGRFFLSAAADKLKSRNTMYKFIFIVSLAMTAAVVLTQGIVGASAGNAVLMVLVLALVFAVNAGYGGGFSNVPTLLSDHYGMSNISAIHGITLSAWAIAGLTGNQMANWIVSKFGTAVEIAGNTVNPTGYQTVLYVTLVMYVIALLCSLFLVRGEKKDK